MTVAVLGTSLESLLAAHAATVAGQAVALFGESTPHEQWCGWAPHPIPQTPHNTVSPDGIVSMIDHGSQMGYIYKVFGNKSPLGAYRSWHPGLQQVQSPAWDLYPLYNWLWDVYGKAVNTMHFHPVEVERLIESEDFDLIISGLPAPRICRTQIGFDLAENPCRFLERKIRTAPVSMYKPDPGSNRPHLLVRDGTPDHSWYRTISVFGHVRTEWTTEFTPPIPGLQTELRPVRSNCRCWSSVVRVGGEARWERGIQPWQAYGQAMAVLQVQ